MSPLIVATALSLLALDAAPAMSQTATVAPARADASPKTDSADDPAKVICKRQPITGSRFERRVCLTRADWVELERRRLEVTGAFERQLGESTGLGPGGNSIPAN